MPSSGAGEHVATFRAPTALDIAGAKTAWQQLLPQLNGQPECLLDLSGVASCDAAGLQLLAALKRAARERGTRLRLCNHTAAMAELIETYGLGSWFGDPLLLPTQVTAPGSQGRGKSRGAGKHKAVRP